MKSKLKAFTAIVLASLLLLTTACATLEGAGEDIEDAGEAVQDAADGE